MTEDWVRYSDYSTLQRELAEVRGELARERENHAQLQARCYEGFPSASDGIFDWLKKVERDLEAARESLMEAAKLKGELEATAGVLYRFQPPGSPPPGGLPELAQYVLEAVRGERDAARSNAKILAHAYMTDNRPPENVVRDSLNYPTTPQAERRALGLK